MNEGRFRSTILLIVAALAALASTGHAQEPVEEGGDAGVRQEPDAPSPAAPSPHEPTAEGPVLKPPQLITFAPAAYPEAAATAGLQARVDLELVINAEGKVTESTVVSPVGDGFDEAARQASFNLVFAPATRDGQPIAARVRFPYVFEMRPEESPPAENAEEVEPVTAEFGGQVLDTDRKPVAGAKVQLLSNEGAVVSVTTDAEGRFSFPPLSAATYTVRVTAPSLTSRTEPETLTAGQRTTVIYLLQQPPDPQAYGAVARISPPPREVTRRSLGRTELTRMPGTRGDALQAIQLLPGVARPPFGAGLLIVRGSSPQDSQVQLEGVPMPALYHFGGITSVFSSQLLESIEFFPGNFSTRYGRRRGGIVEVNVRDPKHDGYAGMLDINVLDTYAVLEGPVAEDLDVALAFRRSYIDLVLNAALSGSEVNIIAAPVYYDYQGIATYKPTSKDRLRLMLFGSSDRFAVLFSQPSDETGGAGGLDLSTQFHRAQLSWYRNVSDDVDHDLELAVARQNQNFGLGNTVGLLQKGTPMTGRSEWRVRMNDVVRVIGGLDVQMTPGRVEYQGPALGQMEGNPNSRNMDLKSSDIVSRERNYFNVQPAGYVELDVNVHPVRLVPGVRLDYYSLIKAYTFDPRLTSIYTLRQDTRLKAGVGLFSQPPQPQESDEVLGNPNLTPSRTVHTSAGIEQDFGDAINLGAEGFYKHLFDVVVGTQNGVAPHYTNGGLGRIYGLELSGKVKPVGRFFGYLSYTLMRSERRDATGGFRLFDFDQTHILTLSSVYRLGAGWELGGTFRLVSGNPTTPVVGSVTGTDTDSILPIYGATNSSRSPMFHRLDVLVRKTWTFDWFKFMVYLDVQNIYNRQNAEGVMYDARYKNSAVVSGLPILPDLGIRGEF